MGDANLFMTDHFVRGCAGQFVPAVHEGSAVLMALAHAHVLGKIGVATVTHGPALTNCVTALTEGVRVAVSMGTVFADQAQAHFPRARIVATEGHDLVGVPA